MTHESASDDDTTSGTSRVAAGKVVLIKYILRDAGGNELDRSREPSFAYLHGASNVVPGLEEALEGREPGQRLEVKVPAEKGYGPKRGVKAQRVLRSKFPADAEVRKGTRFVMQGPDGRPFPIWVTKVMGREVHVSPEHPLAGKDLFFEIEVCEVRDATEEEKAHGHPHGPGGHSHGEDEGDEVTTAEPDLHG